MRLHIPRRRRFQFDRQQQFKLLNALLDIVNLTAGRVLHKKKDLLARKTYERKLLIDSPQTNIDRLTIFLAVIQITPLGSNRRITILFRKWNKIANLMTAVVSD